MFHVIFCVMFSRQRRDALLGIDYKRQTNFIVA